ncbi:MAG TPA: homocysteine S-methyltransferase family protein [bacterium]|nr:homocysteine S-methyltransferase family protein [bacterium]HPP30149.1 homocysteine S-methyltransferase family protein [bacterium]
MILEKIIKENRVVITDGSMGTYLEKSGYTGKSPELAVIEKPDMIMKIHREYIEAGARVILTDTFGANELRLAKKGMAERMRNINLKAVEIALNAKGEREVSVAGDIGPSGELLEPYGNLIREEAGEIFLKQAEILINAGADFILLETFQDIEELKIAFSSIREKLNVFVLPCITLSSGDNPKTLMGQGLEDIVRFADEEKVDVIGINCGVSSGDMVKIVKKLKGMTDIPLWVKPNAGQPQLVNGKVVYPESVEEFVSNCIEMVRDGVKFIGGCCGTNPEYIKLLKAAIDENR